MTYGSKPYGSSEYGGALGGGGSQLIEKSLQYTLRTTHSAITKSLEYEILQAPSTITKSLRYAIAVSTKETKALKYGVLTTTAITKSLHYEIGANVGMQKSLRYAVYAPRAAKQKSLKYTVASTPTAVQHSLRYDIQLYPETIEKTLAYIVLKRTTIAVPLQYVIVAPHGAKSMQLQYVVVPAVQDGEDFSKEVTVASHQTFPYTLWNNFAAGAGAATQSLDVSQISSIGFYLKASAATVVDIQAKTADSIDGSGWTTYQSYTFDAAGSASFGIWFLPFTTMRLVTESAVTITAEIFLRT